MFEKLFNNAGFLQNLSKLVSSKYVNVGQSDFDFVDGMFPRVYKQSFDVELTIFGTNEVIDPEFLDNVVDKFIRVIDPFVEESKMFSRRNDREEIRRRLAMGAEDDYFSKIVNPDNRPIRKPSLQSRIKSGKNLQICFVNETQSDTESVSSDSESCPTLSRLPRGSSINQIKKLQAANPYSSRPLSVSCTETDGKNSKFTNEETDNDFFTKQARLQIEARMALAQAKDMAHMQMEIEKQKQNLSPVTEIIQGSMKKVGVPLPQQKRRVSRQTLTDLNVAQLQVIVNELHSQIESFNTNLVQLLMDRDDLHMGQDAMLVDIEDLTRYLSAKEQTLENDKFMNTKTKALNNTRKVHTQSKLQKFANLVKK